MTESLNVDTSIRIAAPVEVVWQVLTDLPRYADWNPYLVKASGDLTEGGELNVLARAGSGETMPLSVQIERLGSNQMIWIGGLDDRTKFCGEHWFVLEEQNEHTTLLRHFEKFSGSLAADILSKHKETITDNFERMNEALRVEAERLYSN